MPAPSDSPAPAKEQVASSHKAPGYTAWVGLLLVCAFVVLVRSRWLTVPLERDEGEFAYGGQLLLEGVPPFKLLYNIKQPGIYAAYALIMAVFGQTPAGIHCGLMIANVAAIILTFLLARRFFGGAGSVAAAASYGLMSLSASYLGAAAHATQFVAMAGPAGLLVLVKAAESGRRPGLFGAGILFGVAFELKQPGLMFAVFGTLYLFYIECQRTRLARPALVRVLILGTGCVIPYLLTCMWLWHAGVFATFWKWTWRYAYGHSLPLEEGWGNLCWFVAHHLMRPDQFFWVLAFAGLLLTLCRKDFAAQRKVFLAGLLVCLLLATALGLYFETHYFVLVLPALALINGSVFDAMQRSWRPGPVILTVLLLACGVFDITLQCPYFFTMSPTQVAWFCYRQSPFTAALVAAQYIQTNSAPGATVAVLESEPEIYFYAHRRSATGYIYAYDFMGQRTFGQEMQNEVIREVESARPEWIVYVSSPRAWGIWDYSSTTVLDWCKRYIPAHYDLVGVVDQQEAGEVLYAWGPDAAARFAPGPAGLKIFKRKPAQDWKEPAQQGIPSR